MNTYFAYIRVSTTKQGEHGSSLQEQRSSIEAFAKKNGISISMWFEEQETAAKVGRTQFAKMITLLRKGKAPGVIIHKIDRSARNFKDWADINDLIDQGIQVHFAHDSIDLQTRGGRLVADVQAVIAADYIRNLREEVKKGFYGRLKQGLYPIRAPIGYVDNGGGKPKTHHPVMAPIVRMAFEMYATGKYNLQSLHKEVTKLGLRNYNDEALSLSGLSTVLNNSFYYGLILIQKTGETYQGVHEPIISKRLFDAVQDRLYDRVRNVGLVHSHHFRKEFRCKTCSYYLIGETQKGSVYYRCHNKDCPPNSIREDVLASKIAEELKTIVLTKNEIEIINEFFENHLKSEEKFNAEKIQSARLRVAKADERIARLTDAYIDRVIDQDAYTERRAEILNERTQAQTFLQENERIKDRFSILCEKILELQNAFKDKGNSEKYAFLLKALKSTTSNFFICNKTLEITWLSGFDVLSKRRILECCGQRQNARRIFWGVLEQVREQVYNPIDVDNRISGKLKRIIAKNKNKPKKRLYGFESGFFY